MNITEIKDLVDIHIGHLTIGKDISDKTVKQYEYVLTKFLRPIRNMKEITFEKVVDYIGSRENRSLKLSTRYSQFFILKSFMRALVFRKIKKASIIDELNTINWDYHSPTTQTTLTDDEIFKLRDACEETRHSVRNRLMLDVALETGLRVSELNNVRVNDVEESLIINVRSRKGHPETNRDNGIALITEPTYIETMAYIIEMDIINDTKVIAISRSQIFRIIKKLAEIAKILKDISPHTCRHTWATKYYLATKDLYGLQILGGWANDRTPRRYTHLNTPFLKEQHSIAFASLN